MSFQQNTQTTNAIVRFENMQTYRVFGKTIVRSFVYISVFIYCTILSSISHSFRFAKLYFHRWNNIWFPFVWICIIDHVISKIITIFLVDIYRRNYVSVLVSNCLSIQLSNTQIYERISTMHNPMDTKATASNFWVWRISFKSKKANNKKIVAPIRSGWHGTLCCLWYHHHCLPLPAPIRSSHFVLSLSFTPIYPDLVHSFQSL